MAQLVSDFIITPVLRQARRFSTGFATNDAPEPSAMQHRRTVSTGGSAIPERDENARLSTADTVLDPSDEPAIPDRAQQGPAAGTDPLSPSLHRGLRTASEHPTAVPTTSVADTAPDGQPSPQSADPAIGAIPSAAWPPADPLPEDDGMGDLRRKIQAIQSMDAPQDGKAKMMHRLLTEKYTKSQQSPKVAQTSLRPVSPASTSTLDPPEAPEHIGPLQALKKWNPLGEGSGPLSLPLTEEDLRPTYAPRRRPAHGAEWVPEEDDEEEEKHLGCEHYRRNVKLQCASCEHWYTCRLCHDAVEDHVLPRQRTKHMLCMLCGCAQKASDSCVKCGQSAAYYYCGICKLWNDDPNKNIYHCPDCGLCRVGQGLGKDFVHCKKCMACVSIGGNHKCIERSIDCDCPICNEYLFNSPKPVIFMQCGHSIHRLCFGEHIKRSYKCPICSKSCVNMEYQFRNYDMAILAQPMPPEYRDARAVILCNDCCAKSQTQYHWLGLKCAVCKSYNTAQLQLLNMPGQATSSSTANGDQTHHQQESSQQQQQQRQAVALDAAFLAEEHRRRRRAARREQERQQRQQQQQRERNGRDATASAVERGFALLSTSPSSYSPAFLLRLLHRTAVGTLSFSDSEAGRAGRERAAGLASPSPAGRDRERGDGVCASSSSSAAATTTTTRGDGHPAACDSDFDGEEDEEDDDEEDEELEHMLDLFGMRDRDFERMTGLTSAESDGDDDDEEEEDEESSSESELEGDEGDDDDDEDDEDEILLLGHR